MVVVTNWLRWLLASRSFWRSKIAILEMEALNHLEMEPLGRSFWRWNPCFGDGILDVNAKSVEESDKNLILHMGVSKNRGTPKSSILIGFSIIFTIHFWVPLFLETPIFYSDFESKQAFVKTWCCDCITLKSVTEGTSSIGFNKMSSSNQFTLVIEGVFTGGETLPSFQ